MAKTGGGVSDHRRGLDPTYGGCLSRNYRTCSRYTLSAARALLGRTLGDLAARRTTPIDTLLACFEAAGVRFIQEPGEEGIMRRLPETP